MFAESDLLPISALQHLLFCERQCALIHLERAWAENRLTVEGRHLHERAHAGTGEWRAETRVARGLPLRSLRLGLVGLADVVEFTETTTQPEQPAAVVFPVEYKRGRPKSHDADRVQLCAQALCLEEMLATEVPRGALYYGRTRRRQEVVFDAELRALTESTADRLHELIASQRTPRAEYEKRKCEHCSLINVCLPLATGGRSVARFVQRALAAAEYQEKT